MDILNKIKGKFLSLIYGVVVIEDKVFYTKKYEKEVKKIFDHYDKIGKKLNKRIDVFTRSSELFFLAHYIINNGVVIKKIKPVKNPKHLAGDELPEYYRSVYIERKTGDFNGVSVMEGHMVWTESKEDNVWIGNVGETKDYVFDIQGDDIWKYI